MKYLEEMCCEVCAAKLKAIEDRAVMAPTPTTMAEAFADRRLLLIMVEALLGETQRRRKQLLEFCDIVLRREAEPLPPPEQTP